MVRQPISGDHWTIAGDTRALDCLYPAIKPSSPTNRDILSYAFGRSTKPNGWGASAWLAEMVPLPPDKEDMDCDVVTWMMETREMREVQLVTTYLVMAFTRE